MLDYKLDLEAEFVHLARLALGSRAEDVVLLAKKVLPAVIRARPDLKARVQELQPLLRARAVRGAPQSPLPVDLDSRLELLRREHPALLPEEPIWQTAIASSFDEICREREAAQTLLEAGLSPTRSLLFVGQPGVGKTLGAKYLANRLDLPLLTLDLAAVMSSFLGRTGNNIRVVLDFARKSPSVLLLDEFDAIAKRRDDRAEIGELKRLVTVLLQSVDEWPSSNLLIAATNHEELLDPAVWRRFDRVLRFPLPSNEEIGAYLKRSFEGHAGATDFLVPMAAALAGCSFSDLSRISQRIQRLVLVSQLDISEAILLQLSEFVSDLDFDERIAVAKTLGGSGVGQRQIHEVTGLSRDTLRKRNVAVSKKKKGTRNGKQ